jgi:transcriptional regulator with XRE-family HTH domain
MKINEKIKSLRANKGISLSKLAVMANLTKGYLSKIESSNRVPPVSTLQTLAVALGIDISDFFDGQLHPAGKSDSLDIVRKNDGPPQGIRTAVSLAGYAFKPLLKNFKNKYMAPFLMIVEKGQTDLVSHDSEEFDYVVRGTIEFEYEEKSYTFEEGDSFYFDSRKPHRVINRSKEPAVLIAVNYNYRRF